MRKYTVKLTIFTLLVLLVIWLVFNWFLPEYEQAGYYVMLGIFFLLTWAAHFLNAKSLGGRAHQFSTRFLLLTLVKLFFVLGGMVVYLLFYRDGVIPFVLVTFVLYVLFTAFELRELTGLVRKK